MCEWMAEQGVEGLVIGQRLLRVTRDSRLWGTMVAHNTQKKNNGGIHRNIFTINVLDISCNSNDSRQCVIFTMWRKFKEFYQIFQVLHY